MLAARESISTPQTRSHTAASNPTGPARERDPRHDPRLPKHISNNQSLPGRCSQPGQAPQCSPSAAPAEEKTRRQNYLPPGEACLTSHCLLLAAANSIQKRLPDTPSDSTPTLPPMRSAAFLTMARP